MLQYPPWMKKTFSSDGTSEEVRALVRELRLNTVCQGAGCPNIGECYSQRQLTFMILGGVCTRRCRFCAVESGRTDSVASDEPWRVSEAVARLRLRHVVITSVSRDDLSDLGANQFIRVAQAIREHNSGVTIELLVPDFLGREDLVGMVIEEAHPDVFGHNVETVERLSFMLRSKATYRRSLDVLRIAACKSDNQIVKSGIMVGLGEKEKEVVATFDDLKNAGVSHITIGQYIRPGVEQVPVTEYVSPGRFEYYEKLAYDRGFAWVKSGPFVRSSYHAADALSYSRSSASQ